MNVGQEMSEEGERRVREDCYKIERGVEPSHVLQVPRYSQPMYVSHRLPDRATKRTSEGCIASKNGLQNRFAARLEECFL